MKVYFLSDLHLEFNNPRPELVPADVVILAGDIHQGRQNVLKTLNRFSKHYKHVLYCPGNHEYYNGGLELRSFCDLFPNPNVKILNPGWVDIGNYRFVGGTLWTNFGEDPLAQQLAQDWIQDFKRAGLKTESVKLEFYKQVEHFKLAYETRGDREVVFFSHFSPSLRSCHPKWGANLLNKYFHNQLDPWLETLSGLWFHGHTHDANRYQLGSLHILSNPYGYPQENKKYQPLVLNLAEKYPKYEYPKLEYPSQV